MSSVNNVGANTPIQKIQTTPIQKQVPANAPAQVPVSGGDKVELSGVSHLMAALKKNDIRADKVAEIKAQIANGTYDEDKKLDGALDGLLDDLTK
jgi:negative regulator of flagellin synthesis FlgM